MDVELFRMAKYGLGLTNKAIEEQSGIHRNTVNRAELGRASPDTMLQLQKFFTDLGVRFVETEDGLYGILVPNKVHSTSAQQETQT
jgi:transcriptional regulator with XRE-family HTH domain